MKYAIIGSKTTRSRRPAVGHAALIAGLVSMSLTAVGGADEARTLADMVRYRASAPSAKVAASHEMPATDQQAAALAATWGVEVASIRLTANRHMIDYRYKVLDAEKAADLFKRQVKPQLIHQETGRVLAVPDTAKVGPLRNSNTPQQGKVYWMFFGNAEGLVQAGDMVTVVIGDFVVADLVVE